MRSKNNCYVRFRSWLSTKKNLVGRFHSLVQKNRIFAFVIILCTIVIAISLPLGALDNIISFYKKHLRSDIKSEHVVLFPKLELTYIPKIGETSVSPLRLGLTFWNCNETVFDISTVIFEFSDPASNSYVQIGSNVTDKDGAPIVTPLVFSPYQKEDLIFNFRPIAALPEDFKLRITAYTHKTSDKLIAEVAFKRLTNGYIASLDINGKHSEFACMETLGSTKLNVPFLKPFKKVPIISMQGESRYKGR